MQHPEIDLSSKATFLRQWYTRFFFNFSVLSENGIKIKLKLIQLLIYKWTLGWGGGPSLKLQPLTCDTFKFAENCHKFIQSPVCWQSKSVQQKSMTHTHSFGALRLLMQNIYSSPMGRMIVSARVLLTVGSRETTDQKTPLKDGDKWKSSANLLQSRHLQY